MFFHSNPDISIAELQEVTHESRYYTPQSLIALVNTQRREIEKALFTAKKSNIYAWLFSMVVKGKVGFYLSPEILPHQRVIQQDEPRSLEEFLSYSSNEQKRVMMLVYRVLRTTYMADKKAIAWQEYPMNSKPDFREFFGIDSDESVEENRVYLHIPRSGVKNSVSESGGDNIKISLA